jgi:hypothetical protein
MKSTHATNLRMHISQASKSVWVGTIAHDCICCGKFLSLNRVKKNNVTVLFVIYFMHRLLYTDLRTFFKS